MSHYRAIVCAASVLFLVLVGACGGVNVGELFDSTRDAGEGAGAAPATASSSASSTSSTGATTASASSGAGGGVEDAGVADSGSDGEVVDAGQDAGQDASDAGASEACADPSCTAEPCAPSAACIKALGPTDAMDSCSVPECDPQGMATDPSLMGDATLRGCYIGPAPQGTLCPIGPIDGVCSLWTPDGGSYCINPGG